MLTSAVLTLAVLAPQQPPTRADLAQAYLEFERAWSECRPEDARQQVRFQREVDAVAGAFFAGRYGQVVGLFGRLSDELRGRWPRSPEAFALRRMSAAVRPPIVARDSAKVLRLELWGEELGDSIDAVEVELRGPGGKVVASRSLAVEGARLPEEEAWLVPPSERAGWTIGRYQVMARVGEAERELRGFWLVEESLDEVRARLKARLGEIAAAWDPEQQAALEDARQSVEARCELLSEFPSEIESVQFLLDPVEHRASLEREIAALERGQDPFRGRLGRCWRVTRRGSSIVPYVVYAPPQAAEAAPRPVIVAYHGAGGDENMFLDAYGAGVLQRLADRHGLILITPRTGLLSSNPKPFDDMLDSVLADYAVDEDRVYILGHSMGTAATSNLARLRAERIAAACCIAGAFNFHARDPVPPMLLVAGALDPIVRLERIQQCHADALEAAAPVELWVETDAGHTLLVGDELPRIVDWLLEHRRG